VNITTEDFRRLYENGERHFARDVFTALTLYAHERVRDCDFRHASFDGGLINDVTLTNCDFTGATFVDSMFRRTRITNSKLARCTFDGSRLDDVHINKSELSGAIFSTSIMRNCTITQCDLSDSRLSETVLRASIVQNSTAERVALSGVVFADTLIAAFCDSSELSCTPVISVDWLSICRTLLSPRLEQFLLASGMPEIFVRYSVDCARTLDPGMLFRLMLSVFISYGGPNVAFARKLRDALQRNGVRTFLFDSDAVPGMKLHSIMRDEVNRNDRIVLICSRTALDRPGVVNEIEQTLAREARDGGQSYLIPVTIDDYVFHWKPERRELAQEVRDRVVGDFRGADSDDSKFASGVHRLLAALRP
jgi:TIR domain/Pentapeptide repeats (9 copies)/Pentapeptide repeats (8 copies)